MQACMWLMAWLASSGETECTAAAGRLGKCTHGLPTFPPSLLWLCRRYLTGHTTRGVWSSYFLVQVPAIIVERIGELSGLLEPLLLKGWSSRAGGMACNEWVQMPTHLSCPAYCLQCWPS